MYETLLKWADMEDSDTCMEDELGEMGNGARDEECTRRKRPEESRSQGEV